MANRLPRLQSTAPIVDKDGRPAQAFQRYFQSLVESIERRQADLADTQERLDQQQEDIAEALRQAGIAVLTSEQNKEQAALANSYTSPGGLLSAADTGVITILAHVRIYGDDTAAVPHRANVAGGTVSVTPSPNPVFVYYSDPERDGGAVFYQASANYLNAAQVGSIHSVGTITVPAAGEPPETGGGTYPPGYTPGRPRPLPSD